MNIDINQFVQSFLEESFEGLEIMESQLLGLKDDADTETINTIFRAIHSIKGGAGTFGFREVAEFAHGVETLLDQMRAHKRSVNPELVKLLLEANDCIRDLLIASRDGVSLNAQHIDRVRESIDELLQGPASADKAAPAPVAPAAVATAVAVSNAAEAAPEPEAEASPAPGAVTGFRIHFVPEHGILRTGNDPLRIFNALADLGELSAHCELDQLVPLDALEPEECLLSWQLVLKTEAPEAKVRELFEWVEDECELVIEALAAVPSADTVDALAEPAASAEERLDAPEDTGVADVHPDTVSDDGPTQDEIPAPKPADTRATPVAETAETAADTPTAPEHVASSAKRPPADTPKPDLGQARSTERRGGGESGSIRVNTDKIDALINLVGELVITQSMLSQIGEKMQNQENDACLEKLFEGLTQLERNTRELQENVMSIRMLPISFAFNRFPRMVHDLSAQLGKQVELRLSGEQTELDKTVMEKIGDPLVHLVRNAVDHGIEPPEARSQAGKSPVGVVHLNAYHKGGNIMIEISDDGWGLNRDKILKKAVEKGVVAADQHLSDEQIFDLVFAPGFSTADQVSDVSGRGVGMDVVRRNIKSLGGSVEVRTAPGKGSTFSIRLPLTLAILDGQLLQVGGETYIVPLVSIVESLQVRANLVKSVAEHNLMYRLRDEYIPILFLNELLGVPGTRAKLHEALLVVVETEGQKAALVVDDLLGQQQVVIKALETNYRRVEGLSGATILGDGSVALILDVAGLIVLGRQHSERHHQQKDAATAHTEAA
ncbi:chemotaxis protein CheA [Thiorhodospira sibirica]|uniref:chemotaxis protein CheA n=1 Tax=Thiorhodospira sibirica TaxID=154347 RepID=UPI0003055BA4|nr:chemotaxis protein CheA [Thiorhodospira sibirica]